MHIKSILVKIESQRRIEVDPLLEVQVKAVERRRVLSIKRRGSLRVLQKVALLAGNNNTLKNWIINVFFRTRKGSKSKELPSIELKINVRISLRLFDLA